MTETWYPNRGFEPPRPYDYPMLESIKGGELNTQCTTVSHQKGGCAARITFDESNNNIKFVNIKLS